MGSAGAGAKPTSLRGIPRGYVSQVVAYIRLSLLLAPRITRSSVVVPLRRVVVLLLSPLLATKQAPQALQATSPTRFSVLSGLQKRPSFIAVRTEKGLPATCASTNAAAQNDSLALRASLVTLIDLIDSTELATNVNRSSYPLLFFGDELFDTIDGVHKLRRENDGRVFFGGDFIEHL